MESPLCGGLPTASAGRERASAQCNYAKRVSGIFDQELMKPTYFDLTVRDVGQARAFFESVLGWRFEKFDMPYEYFRICAGSDSEPGIDGGVGSVKDAPLSQGKPMTQVTVPVPDLDKVLALVIAAGGSIVEQKISIPGVGWYATCAEPGGLIFGLVQSDQGVES